MTISFSQLLVHILNLNMDKSVAYAVLATRYYRGKETKESLMEQAGWMGRTPLTPDDVDQIIRDR